MRSPPLGNEIETIATHRWPRHVLAKTGPVSAITGSGIIENLALHDFDGDGRPEIYANVILGKNAKALYRFVKDAKGKAVAATGGRQVRQ